MNEDFNVIIDLQEANEGRVEKYNTFGENVMNIHGNAVLGQIDSMRK